MEILYLIIARAFGATKGYAMKRASERAPTADNCLCTNLIRTLICIGVSVVLWLVSGAGASSSFGNVLVLLSGISNALNIYFWIICVQYVSISTVEVFSMIGTVIIPMILAPFLYNGDTVSPIQWIGCAVLLVAALLFASQEKRAESGNPYKKVLSIFFLVLGIAGVSVTQKMYAYHISSHGLGSVEYFNLGTFVCVGLLFVALFAVREISARRAHRASPEVVIPSRDFPFKRVILYIIIAAVGLYAYQYFLTLASTLDSAILYPMSYALAMASSLILDTFFFKQKFTPKRMLGTVCVAIVIVLVNLKI